MILFRALSRFRALFDGDGLSAQNRDTTVPFLLTNIFKNREIQTILQGYYQNLKILWRKIEDFSKTREKNSKKELKTPGKK